MPKIAAQGVTRVLLALDQAATQMHIVAERTAASTMVRPEVSRELRHAAKDAARQLAQARKLLPAGSAPADDVRRAARQLDKLLTRLDGKGREASPFGFVHLGSDTSWVAAKAGRRTVGAFDAVAGAYGLDVAALAERSPAWRAVAEMRLPGAVEAAPELARLERQLAKGAPIPGTRGHVGGSGNINKQLTTVDLAGLDPGDPAMTSIAKGVQQQGHRELWGRAVASEVGVAHRFAAAAPRDGGIAIAKLDGYDLLASNGHHLVELAQQSAARHVPGASAAEQRAIARMEVQLTGLVDHVAADSDRHLYGILRNGRTGDWKVIDQGFAGIGERGKGQAPYLNPQFQLVSRQRHGGGRAPLMVAFDIPTREYVRRLDAGARLAGAHADVVAGVEPIERAGRLDQRFLKAAFARRASDRLAAAGQRGGYDVPVAPDRSS